MTTKKKPKMADITVADLRNLKATEKEGHEWRMRLHDEVRELKAEISNRKANRDFVCRTLEAERMCLEGRLMQINLTLRMFGWKNPSTKS